MIRYDRDWITKWFFALLLTVRADRDPTKVIGVRHVGMELPLVALRS